MPAGSGFLSSPQAEGGGPPQQPRASLAGTARGVRPTGTTCRAGGCQHPSLLGMEVVVVVTFVQGLIDSILLLELLSRRVYKKNMFLKEFSWKVG